jgi:hypothetical protein
MSPERKMAIQDLRVARAYAQTALKTLYTTAEGNAYAGEVENVVEQIDQTIAVLDGR